MTAPGHHNYTLLNLESHKEEDVSTVTDRMMQKLFKETKLFLKFRNLKQQRKAGLYKCLHILTLLHSFLSGNMPIHFTNIKHLGLQLTFRSVIDL